MAASLFVYRVINDQDNTSLPEPHFDADSAIAKAKELHKASKNKLDFRVVKTIPVYSTKEVKDAAKEDIGFF